MRLKEGVPDKIGTSALSRLGKTQRVGRLPVHRVQLGPGREVLKAAEEARNDPSVEWAQPNYRYYATACAEPGDGYYTTLGGAWSWALEKIQAPAGWGLFSSCPPGSSGVIVAVLDSGTSYNHPDLLGVAKVLGYNGLTDQREASFPNAADDDFGHGTFVAGIIAAQWNASNAETCPPGGNTTGAAGVAPGITLMRVKVLDSSGSGDSLSIYNGIEYAVANGAKVLNLSLGSPPIFGLPPLEKLALDDALAASCVVVAAAGNETSGVDYPAAYPPVLAVGATDAADQVACYSNFGPSLDLMAPGGAATIYLGGCYGNPFFSPAADILSSMLQCPFTADPGEFPRDPADANFGTAAGTSASAPFVSAAAALVLSMYTTLSGPQVVERLMNNADSLNGGKGWDPQTGYGRLNLYRALLPAASATPEITRYLKTFNSPNPFRPEQVAFTNITLALDSPEAVDLEIFDGSGERVLEKHYDPTQLNDNPSNPQFKSYYLSWDGRNGGGQKVSSGVYFYTVKTSKGLGRNKIVVIRGVK